MLPEYLTSRISQTPPKRLVSPYNWIEHIPFAFWLIESLRPKTLVELGVYSGNSYLAFCQAIKQLNLNTQCYAVDTWEGDIHVGKYGDGIYASLSEYNDKNYADFSRLLRCTFDDAVETFKDGSIDLLHIDGTHTYESVSSDFETWLPKCSDRCVILFHDTNVRQKGFGVYKLWDQLSGRYPHFEFLHGNGLGVLAVGPQIAPLIGTLTSTSNSQLQKSELRGFYAKLGKKISSVSKEDNLIWHILNILFSKQKSHTELDMGKSGEHQSITWMRIFMSRIKFLIQDSRVYRYFYNKIIRRRLFGLTAEHYNSIFESVLQRDPEYRSESHPEIKNSLLRIIAFYLPQFHTIPENDEWWGKGFTEWTNVTKSAPQFIGHYQPHLPGELGFYDLRYSEVYRRQIELARQYGIHGFCFYHYWFSGKRLLEKPVNRILSDPSLNFPFCLCWANENWTRQWDGRANELLITQNNSPDDDLSFIKDIFSTLKDPRYIRIDGRPLLIVYRVSLLPNATRTAEIWRKYCIDEGIGDLYLVSAQTNGLQAAPPTNFDAAIEFPPHNLKLDETPVKLFNPNFTGSINRYSDLIQHEEALRHPDYPLFKTVFPSWDNSARRIGKGKIFHDSTPDLFAKWLDSVCLRTIEHARTNEERLVFINAWNEWAEGAHLEPDRRYGYAYLEAVAKVLNLHQK